MIPNRLKVMFNFYCTGFDSGFSFGQMNLVWKLARLASVEEPTVLFWSIPAINRAIASIVSITKNIGEFNSASMQEFLNKVYAYRSKLELDPPLKQGMKKSSLIRTGQRLRIVLAKNGIFTSIVLNNEGLLTISYPIPIKDNYRCFDWSKKKITVYFWRKNDAGYVFDTNVYGVGHYHGRSVLFLEHSDSLQRSQKRKTIRCPCSISAELYLLYDNTITDLNSLEIKKGIKCLLEDLSEDGALIRIGGKGQEKMPLKVQFFLGETEVVMSGTVKSVEYNETIDQSRLHFQATNITDEYKQIISLYVYSVIPEEQKQAFDAIKLIEEDENTSLTETEIEELETSD